MSKTLASYLIRRIAQAVLVLWAAYTVAFTILNLLPSNPLALVLQARGMDLQSLSAEQVEALKSQYGLDRPEWQQYFSMLFGALHGDFGTSYTYGTSVGQLIAARFSSTVLISVLAIVLSLVVAFSLAFLASFTNNRGVRSFLRALPTLGKSVPGFWIGLLLMQVFSFWLGWVPSMGMDGWRTLILPTITMAIPTGALLGQLLMSGFDEVLAEPFVTVATAHGLSKTSVLVRHVLKNASLPVLTVLGLCLGDVVTGAIIAETIFSRQGIGMLVQQAVQQQDIPVVQGVVLLAAFAFVLVNLAVDLIYPILDPRLDLVRKGVAQ